MSAKPKPAPVVDSPAATIPEQRGGRPAAVGAERDKFAREVLDGSVDGYVAMDHSLRITAWNRSAQRLFGWTEAEAIGRLMPDLIVPERLRPRVSADVRTFVTTGTTEVADRVIEQVACRRDGTEFPVELAVTSIGQGQAASFHVFIRDAGERKAAERQLRLLGSVFEQSRDAICVTGLDGSITAWNPAAEIMYGYSAAEVLGQPLDMLSHPSARERQLLLLQSVQAGSSAEAILTRVRKDGTAIQVGASAAPLLDATGELVGYSCTTRDLTEQLRTEARVRKSRQLLQSLIDNTESATCVRDHEFRFVLANQAFSDLFHLPPPSEIAGRPDTEVLPAQVVAQGRVIDQRAMAGERIRREETIVQDGEERTYVAQLFALPDDEDRHGLIATILTDITERKRAEEDLLESIHWEEHISRVINDGRLLVYVQPIIDLASGAKCQEELLVRIQGGHGPGDVVEPAEFLPQAERFGLMPTIDRFMLEQGIRLAEAGRQVSVNLSASSLESAAFAHDVALRLAGAPEAAANLEFEITETAAVAAPDIARDFSRSLADLGCGVALDDFGTGYGSLTELRHLTLKELKIDRSFVTNLPASPDDQRVVKLIIHIAREFGLLTTAEGVEDSATLDLLRGLGVDRAQGFLIGRPAPVIE